MVYERKVLTISRLLQHRPGRLFNSSTLTPWAKEQQAFKIRRFGSQVSRSPAGQCLSRYKDDDVCDIREQASTIMAVRMRRMCRCDPVAAAVLPHRTCLRDPLPASLR